MLQQLNRSQRTLATAGMLALQLAAAGCEEGEVIRPLQDSGARVVDSGTDSGADRPTRSPLDAATDGAMLATGDSGFELESGADAASSMPDAAEPDAAEPDAGPRPCGPNEAINAVQLRTVMVREANGGALEKGAELAVELEIDVESVCVGSAAFEVRITSERFSDYDDVPLGEVSVDVTPGRQTVRVEGGPFLSDTERNKHYALGSGRYRVSRVDIEFGETRLEQTDFEGGAFELASNSVLLIPVVYDQRYLDGIEGLNASSAEEYLTQVMTRPSSLFTPSSADPDGAGEFQTFEGGFDEMMGVRHLFRAFPGFPGENTTNEGWCEDATAYGQQVLGMASRWESRPQGTQTDRHGFDYLIALTPDMGGGVACGWIDVQVSSFIYRDVDRQQVVAVHESGHLFGAPHCNDTGNGDGGDLLGYVMCSGEVHPRYPGEFVWHRVSRDRMSSRWD